jgi:hypothetical protein
MRDQWHIESVGTDGAGVIEHRAAPRFRALWTTGLEDITAIKGLFWSDEGHGEEDAITLHHFRFEGAAPDQAAFEALMREAVIEIDGWIARRL